MRRQSQQVMFDAFFCSLSEGGDWQRRVSDHGFAKARDRLAWGALDRLNTFVVERADALGLVARWCGLRVVAMAAVAVRKTTPGIWAMRCICGSWRSFSDRRFSIACISSLKAWMRATCSCRLSATIWGDWVLSSTNDRPAFILYDDL
jgi:hypothetical protein